MPQRSQPYENKWGKYPRLVIYKAPKQNKAQHVWGIERLDSPIFRI